MRFTIRGVELEICPALLDVPLADALRDGVYEGGEAECILELLCPSDTFVEFGGGVGFLSALAFRIVGTGDRLAVYEATPALLPILLDTWNRNGVSGAAYCAVVGRASGEVDFHVARAFWGSTAHTKPRGSRTIRVRQVAFHAEVERTGATFLLVDIEGGELALLDEPLPARVRAVVVECHPLLIGETRVREVWRALQIQGFALRREVGQVRAYVRR